MESQAGEPSVSIEQDLKRFTPDVTKAEKARRLLKLGYSVSVISRAVPIAYSQVHSINKILGTQPRVSPLREPAKADPKPLSSGKYHRGPQRQRLTEDEAAMWHPPAKPRILKIKKGIGKLRTGGYPSDVEVGKCANCDFDLVVRDLPTGYALIHVNEQLRNTLQSLSSAPQFRRCCYDHIEWTNAY